MPDNLFIGRQPIFDRQQNVVAYELLFRAGEENSARFEKSDLASSRVIVGAFMEIGLETLVGSLRAHINLARPFLTGEVPLSLSPEQVALEVRPDIAGDDAAMGGLERFRSRGFRILLDAPGSCAEAAPLLPLVHGAKLNVLELEEDELALLVAELRGRHLQSVAQRVETPEMHRHCLQLGCDYFQGFYFCRPVTVSGRSLPAGRMGVLTLLAQLESPDRNVAELEQLISQDATLCYRLLRYVNCATFALRREIDSLHDAILLLGARTIRNWAYLILFAHMDASRPPELLNTALVRARTCEQLARRLRTCDPDSAFTVGLLSTLDALLDRPMDELLDTVPLGVPLKLALLDGSGDLGDILQRAVSHESGDWRQWPAADAELHRRAYLDALSWTRENGRLLRNL